MPRTHAADVLTPMRWCPVHELAWLIPWNETPGWHPLSRWKVMMALAYAEVFGCQHTIQVTLTTCSHCAERREVPR